MQVKDEVGKDLCNKYVDEKKLFSGDGKKNELDSEVVAKVFAFPFPIHLKLYLAKRRGQKVSS